MISFLKHVLINISNWICLRFSAVAMEKTNVKRILKVYLQKLWIDASSFWCNFCIFTFVPLEVLSNIWKSLAKKIPHKNLRSSPWGAFKKQLLWGNFEIPALKCLENFPRRKEHFLLVKKHTHYHRCFHGYFLKFFRAAILQKSSKSLIFWFVKSAQGQFFFLFSRTLEFFLNISYFS